MSDYTNYKAIVDNTVATMKALSREAYASGVTTQDPFYAGVEALAYWLSGDKPLHELDPRLLNLARQLHSA